MSVFNDQKKFMIASDQTVGELNYEQFKLYAKLITEEYDELQVAVANKDRVETVDALLDIIVVSIGALHSVGVDVDGAWKEVVASNLAKINPRTGRVQKREDGKVIKPASWVPPDIIKYIKTEL